MSGKALLSVVRKFPNMNGTDDPDEPLRGDPMDRDEIDAFLTEQGVGVLSLADEGEAYGLPMSFGYDGDRLYFILVRFGDESTKQDFAETTETASFTTYEFVDEHDWRSVVVSGTIGPVPEDDVASVDETLDDNARFASLFPFGEPMTERPRYQLVPERITGQKGQGVGD